MIRNNKKRGNIQADDNAGHGSTRVATKTYDPKQQRKEKT